MFLVPINYLAMLACSIFAMIVGFIWYGPLFGETWMKLVGMTDKKMEEAKKAGMAKQYVFSFVSSLVMAWMLAHFIWYAAPGSATLTVGLKTALWSFLGFVATTGLSTYLFAAEKKPWKLYFLENGYWLVTILGMAVIIVLMA